MKKILFGLLLTLGLTVSVHAQQYFDFEDEANGDERGVEDGDRVLMNGVYVEFSATSTIAYTAADELAGLGTEGDIKDGYAYFDSGDAGLGVCGHITGSAQCDPNSDDNLTSGETVTISFWDALTDGSQYADVSLSGLIFRDADHVLINDNSTLMFAVDAAGLASTSMTGFGTSDEGSSFTFGYGGDFANQYYISGMMVSGIPEPSTWLMMIIGFGIVTASARRSRRHSGNIMKTC